MSRLVFCEKCHTHFLAQEDLCPHCEQNSFKSTPKSGQFTLSFLLGFSVACNSKTEIETVKPQPQEQIHPEMVKQPLYGVIDIALEPAYGVAERNNPIIPLPILKISSIKLPPKYSSLQSQIQLELQSYIQACDARFITLEKPIQIEISLQSGLIQKPNLQDLDIQPNQKECLISSLWKKKLSTNISGTISITIEAS